MLMFIEGTSTKMVTNFKKAVDFVDVSLASGLDLISRAD